MELKDTRALYSDQKFFADSKRLNELKLNPNDPEGIKEVAQEFEALFLQMALKSMRDAEKVLKSHYFNDQASEYYEEMYDKQLSLHLSQNGGMGLSNMLVKQLTPSDSKDPSKESVLKMPEVSDRSVFESAPKKVPVQRTVLPKPQSVGVQPTESLASNLQDLKTETPLTIPFETPRDFIQAVWPHAVSAASKIGVDPKILLAQAALETGWGKHISKTADGKSSHNVFGIKADKDWSGPRAVSKTTEYRDGVLKRETGVFRAYSNIQESVADYLNFISSHTRYQKALNQSFDNHAYVKAIQEAGYATDPHYHQNIMRVYASPLMKEGMEWVKNFNRWPLK